MKVKKIIGLLVIPMYIGLIFSVQGVRAEKKPENNRQFSLQTDSVKEKFKYTAQDSTKWNKHKSIVALYGKATFSCENFDLTANEIVFNKNTQKVTAKNFTIFNKRNKKTTTGERGEFDVNSKNQDWPVTNNP